MITHAGDYKRTLMQGTKTAAGVITGASATSNGTVQYPTEASGGAYTLHTVQITGISGDTITFEGTGAATDETATWVAIQYTNLNSGTAANTATADGIYQSTKPVSGLMQIRARLTRSAGTVVIWGVLVA
jgi:hypothetical protein